MKDKNRVRIKPVYQIEKLRQRIAQLKQSTVEKERIVKTLSEAEERFHGTLDNMLEGFQIIGYGWRYLYLNDAAARHGRKTKVELMGKTMMESYPGIEATEMFSFLKRSMKKRIPHRMDNEFTYPDGRKGWFDLSIQPVPEGIVVLSQDISDRKKAELELGRINRLLKTINAANQVLVRSANERELIDLICRILINIGGFRMAWVGFMEHDNKGVLQLIAHEVSQKESINLGGNAWLSPARLTETFGKAVAANKPYVRVGLSTDAALPWMKEAVDLGCTSFIALLLVSGGEKIGLLGIGSSIVDIFDTEEVAMLTELADDLAYGIMTQRVSILHAQACDELTNSLKKIRRGLEEAVKTLASVIEKRDPYTSGHQQRVTRLACSIAQELGLPHDRIDGLYLAGILHDIGKISVPSEILSRPVKLAKVEYDLIKIHPRVGYEIMQSIEFPWQIDQMIYQHHERMDGSGYPQGLKGDAIILEARILAVADVVEAMSSHRPYRPALGIDAALQELTENPDKYDKRVAEACRKLFKEKAFTFD